MHIYDCFQHLPYAFEQVATVFWHRYPNTTAKHVISEDFIEVAVSKAIRIFGGRRYFENDAIVSLIVTFC